MEKSWALRKKYYSVKTWFFPLQRCLAHGGPLLLSTTTIASLTLSGCSFRSLDSLAAGSSSLTSLTRVHLHNMRVTTEQVRCFLSSCPDLEDLTLSCCHQMVCFEMPPRLLPRLKSLLVYSCSALLTIRCDAPNKAAEFPIRWGVLTWILAASKYMQ